MPRQDSAYLYAGARGLDEILAMTLAHGADLRSTNRYGGTALIPAAERGHVATVRTLPVRRCCGDRVNRLHWTALLEAILLGDGGRAMYRSCSCCWRQVPTQSWPTATAYRRWPTIAPARAIPELKPCWPARRGALNANPSTRHAGRAHQDAVHVPFPSVVPCHPSCGGAAVGVCRRARPTC
jgi:hypothetical protein